MLLKTSLGLIFLTIYLFSVINASPINNETDGTVVQIDSGFIQGHILKSYNGIDYWAFQEIPYAATTAGENRFMPPQPVSPWEGILNTTANTKECYQMSFSGGSMVVSEDCLFLNVYSPVKPGSNKLLPVFVWIYGGAFEVGSGAFDEFGPQFIIDHGIIIVTMNYRLGTFGFSGTEDGVIPFNVGIKDQHFALKWVNRNINKFGGNNRQVVIVGQSAGSVSVSEHLMGPWEDDVELFQGAIMQSGTAIHVVSSSLDIITNATEVAVNIAQSINASFTPANTTDLLKFLQAADADDILQYSRPVLDYVNSDVKGSFQRFLDGDYKKIPVLMGSTSEEAIFGGLPLNDTEIAITDANSSLLISPAINMSPENRATAGALYKEIYTNGSSFADFPGAFLRHESDTKLFNTAVCKHVELASPYSPYYYYKFSYKGDLGGMTEYEIPAGADKVGHTEDLPYIWCTQQNSNLSQFAEADQLTMLRILTLWTNFVKYLNPTPVEDPLLENVIWLPSEPNSLRYLNINDTLEMSENPRKCKERSAILEKYMEKPFNYFE